MDYTRPNLDLVKEGQSLWTGLLSPLTKSSMACAELLVKALDGETIEYRNLLPAPILLQLIWNRITVSMIALKHQ